MMSARLPASLAERRSCHGVARPVRGHRSIVCALRRTPCAARRMPVDGLYSSAGKDAVGGYATEAIDEAKHAGNVTLV